MNTKQLQDVLRKLISNSRNGNRVSLLIEGVHGIGKSAVVAEVASELGYRLADLRLGQQEVADLIGMPIVKDGCTFWAPPSWWPKEGEKVVIFLDELNRGTQDVKQAIFQLVRDFKLHTHILPDECIVISAINPEADGYDVAPLDIALQDRFWKTLYEPTVVEWLVWAEKANVVEVIREFISQDNIHLDPPKGQAHPTRRGWERLSNALKLVELDKVFDKKSSDLFLDVVIGNVGEAAGLAFRRFVVDKYKPLDAKTIIESYAKIRPKIQKIIENKEMDMLSRAIDDSMRYLEKHINTDEPQANILESVSQLISDLPLDLVASTCRTIGTSQKLLNFWQLLCRNQVVYEQIVKTRDATDEYLLIELFPIILEQELQLEKEGKEKVEVEANKKDDSKSTKSRKKDKVNA